MARKNLLKGLMEGAGAPERKSAAPGAAEPDQASAARAPRPRTGAIGAVSQSIAALKARAVVDLDPDLVDPGAVADRLEPDATAHRELVASIRDHGQQVPVLVRPHPEVEGRYEIVYGRRRLAALRELGEPVRALVRDLDDRQAVLAQGQENSARRDLTFIEKANFARQLRDAGYDRKVVCDALNTDKTLISRLLSVADRVPTEVIEAIGPAPGIGRDRWLALAELAVARDWDADAIIAFARAEGSDQRFEDVMQALTLPDRRRAAKAKSDASGQGRAAAQPLIAASGRRIGEAVSAKGKLRITFREDEAAGFERWLVENMTEIHRDWMKSRGGE